MTVPAATLSLTGDGPQSRASAGELLNFASGDDFARWERQLAATGNCANPIRLRGRIDAIDRATGEKATIYDTASEPGGVLRIPCGNRREDICRPCSDVYKGDARQIIRSGLTGGKGIPETVATHPCVHSHCPRVTAEDPYVRPLWHESGTVDRSPETLTDGVAVPARLSPWPGRRHGRSSRGCHGSGGGRRVKDREGMSCRCGMRPSMVTV